MAALSMSLTRESNGINLIDSIGNGFSSAKNNVLNFAGNAVQRVKSEAYQARFAYEDLSPIKKTLINVVGYSLAAMALQSIGNFSFADLGAPNTGHHNPFENLFGSVVGQGDQPTCGTGEYLTKAGDRLWGICRDICGVEKWGCVDEITTLNPDHISMEQQDLIPQNVCLELPDYCEVPVQSTSIIDPTSANIQGVTAESAQLSPPIVTSDFNPGTPFPENPADAGKPNFLGVVLSLLVGGGIVGLAAKYLRKKD